MHLLKDDQDYENLYQPGKKINMIIFNSYTYVFHLLQYSVYLTCIAYRNENTSASNVPQAAVIPAPQESLIGDLLSMDLTTPAVVPTSVQPPSVDLLASGLDSLLTTSDLPAASSSNTGLLGDIFGFTPTPVSYSPPKQLWLPSENGKGLEIMGTFSRKYVLK